MTSERIERAIEELEAVYMYYEDTGPLGLDDDKARRILRELVAEFEDDARRYRKLRELVMEERYCVQVDGDYAEAGSPQLVRLIAWARGGDVHAEVIRSSFDGAVDSLPNADVLPTGAVDALPEVKL